MMASSGAVSDRAFYEGIIVDTVPLLDGSPEVWHCPELAIGSSCGIARQVGGSIGV
jgi:hypothetical protein